MTAWPVDKSVDNRFPTLGDRCSPRPVPAPTGTAGDRNTETPSDLHVYLSPTSRGQVGTGQSATCPPVPPPYRGTGTGTGVGTALEWAAGSGSLTTAGTDRVAPVRAATATPTQPATDEEPAT